MGAFCLFFFSSYFSECKFVSACPRVLQSFRIHFSLFKLYAFVDICISSGSDFCSDTVTVTDTVTDTVSHSREVRLNLSFVANNYLYFFPERCDHKK